MYVADPKGSRLEGSVLTNKNYVPTLFSYRYWKPAYLLAFLTFNRFACIALFNPVEPNSEVNGHQYPVQQFRAFGRSPSATPS
jgi:hypothetical protein